MATKFLLSWRRQERRWRRRYHGKDYYFRLKDGETKESSYARCMAEWRALKRELDQQPESADQRSWQILIDRAKGELLLLQQEDTPGNRLKWLLTWQFLHNYELARDSGIPWFLEEPPETIKIPPLIEVGSGGLEEEEPPPWEQHHVNPATPTSLPTSVSDNIRDFLEENRLKAQRGDLSISRVEILQRSIKDFGNHLGSVEMADLTEPRIIGYRDNLLRRVDDGKLAKYTAQTYMRVARQFIQWAWSFRRLEDKPRCLEGTTLAITVGAPEHIITFTDEEVAATLLDAPMPLKLHILLMLNCGMTQVDVSDLKQSEVNWINGTITRKRSKTRKSEGAPTVTYPLWPTTWALLQQYRSDAPTVFINRNGQPLLRREEQEGKVKKVDNIRCAFRRFTKDRTCKKPLKIFRKTAASKLAQHAAYKSYAEYFLAEASKNIADRHYVVPSQQQFNDAVLWLGQQFGQMGEKP